MPVPLSPCFLAFGLALVLPGNPDQLPNRQHQIAQDQGSTGVSKDDFTHNPLYQEGKVKELSPEV